MNPAHSSAGQGSARDRRGGDGVAAGKELPPLGDAQNLKDREIIEFLGDD